MKKKNKIIILVTVDEKSNCTGNIQWNNPTVNQLIKVCWQLGRIKKKIEENIDKLSGEIIRK